MILDGLLMFDNVQNFTGYVAGTYQSTNVLDLHVVNGGLPVLASGQGARDIGIGDDPAMKLFIGVTVAFTGGTNLIAKFEGAPDNGSGAPSTYVTYLTSATVLLANLTVGARIMDVDVPRPPPDTTFPRFLRLEYVTTGTMTAGTIEAGLVLDRPDQPLLGTATPYWGGYPAGIIVVN